MIQSKHKLLDFIHHQILQHWNSLTKHMNVQQLKNKYNLIFVSWHVAILFLVMSFNSEALGDE